MREQQIYVEGLELRGQGAGMRVARYGFRAAGLGLRIWGWGWGERGKG